METTKLTVEYLIVGVLIFLAILFLAYSIAPAEIESILQSIIQFPAFVGTGFVVIILSISYGIGLVVEYLGLLMYEKQLKTIKDKRFPIYIQQNLDWIKGSPLLGKFSKKDQSTLKGTGDLIYGDMRFYILMNSSSLYAEVETHLNQARILRVLTIAEIISILGFVIQLITNGINLLSLVFLVTVLVFFVMNIRAIINRFERYCRAVERSFKVLSLSEAHQQSKK